MKTAGVKEAMRAAMSGRRVHPVDEDSSYSWCSVTQSPVVGQVLRWDCGPWGGQPVAMTLSRISGQWIIEPSPHRQHPDMSTAIRHMSKTGDWGRWVHGTDDDWIMVTNGVLENVDGDDLFLMESEILGSWETKPQERDEVAE